MKFLALTLALVCGLAIAVPAQAVSCTDCERFAPMLLQVSEDAYPLNDGNAQQMNHQLCARLPSEFQGACEAVSTTHGLHKVPQLSNEQLCAGLSCNDDSAQNSVNYAADLDITPQTDFLETAVEEGEKDDEESHDDDEEEDEEDDNVDDSDDDDDNDDEADNDDDDDDDADSDELVEDDDEVERKKRRRKRGGKKRRRGRGRKSRRGRGGLATSLDPNQKEGLQFLRLQHYMHEVAMLNKMQSPMFKWFPDHNLDSFLGDDGASDDADLGIVNSDGRDDEEDEMTTGSWDDPANTVYTSGSIKTGLQAFDADGDGPNNDGSMGGFLRKLKKSIDNGDLNTQKGYRGKNMGMGGPSF